jgi:hypothetical protein
MLAPESLASLRSALRIAFGLALAAAPSIAHPGAAFGNDPELSVGFEAVLAGGRQWGGVGARGGVPAAGFALLVRYRALEAGPVLFGSANDQQDGYYLALAGGLSWDPARWARLRATVEGGQHHVGAESAYAGLPLARARLAYGGARVTALAYADLPRSLLFFFARRIGVGLDAAVRWDLQRASVLPNVPPELAGSAAPVELGGTLAAVGFVSALEW